jgi:hypothetical protein
MSNGSPLKHTSTLMVTLTSKMSIKSEIEAISTETLTKAKRLKGKAVPVTGRGGP